MTRRQMLELAREIAKMGKLVRFVLRNEDRQMEFDGNGEPVSEFIYTDGYYEIVDGICVVL